MVKIRIMTPEEETLLLSQIKEGTAKQVHFGTCNSIFRPRGSMMKNSVGEYILGKLASEFESWTDPKYADNPDLEILIRTMHQNLMLECLSAWEKFIKSDEVKNQFEKVGL